MSYSENMYIKVPHYGCASANLSCRSNTGCLIHLAALSLGVYDSLNCFPVHCCDATVSGFPTGYICSCVRTQLSLRSPEAMRKVALLRHISTSCKTSRFPRWCILFLQSEPVTFLGLGLYFSLIYPSGAWGQGCTGRYLYWYVFSSISCYPNFCDTCWAWTKVSVTFWRTERKGETEGEERDRENQSGKFKVFCIFDFPGGGQILMVPLWLWFPHQRN